MAEYISREALLKAVEKMDRLDKETNTQYEYDKEGYILLIQNAPTADVVEVKHSEWILHSDGSGTCKICGKHQKHIWDMDNWQNFCGHCGAKMDGRRDT